MIRTIGRRGLASLQRASLCETRQVARFSDDGSSPEPVVMSSPKLQELYEKCTKLTIDEFVILGSLTMQMIGAKVYPGEFTGGVPGAGGDAVEEEVVEEVVEEVKKTLFDVKLLGFDAKSKIKVIKEVRSIAGLGLKEAKELVEGAPKVIQKDLKPERAEELKAQLEAIGAQVEVV